jgi:hypothetical protein
VADIICNIAKGKIAWYAGLTGGANDALIVVPIETSGIVSDATIKDIDDLSTLLAGASNEQTTMGRKTLASITVTVDDTNDRVDIDAADTVWTAATGNAISALVLCYDPDTTTGSDSDLVLLAKFDFVATPAGGDITAQWNSAGLMRAS